MESVVRQQPRIQLVLADNAGDPGVAALASEYGADRLRSPGNIGFGRAHNLAYQRVRRLSPFHLVLNPDVYFGGAVLESLLEIMSAQPDLGVVMPKILYGNGTTQHLCKRLPTPGDLLVRRFAPGFASRHFSLCDGALRASRSRLRSADGAAHTFRLLPAVEKRGRRPGGVSTSGSSCTWRMSIWFGGC